MDKINIKGQFNSHKSLNKQLLVKWQHLDHKNKLKAKLHKPKAQFFLGMYEEFPSDLSDVLSGSNVDFLSQDFVDGPFTQSDGRGYGNNTKVDRAKAQCETQLTRLWVKQEVEHCGKLGNLAKDP